MGARVADRGLPGQALLLRVSLGGDRLLWDKLQTLIDPDYPPELRAGAAAGR